jgi:hypothetical protein
MTLGLLAELQADQADAAAASVTLRDALRMCFALRDIQTGTVADYGINVCVALARYEVVATIGGILAGAFEGRSTVPAAELRNRAEALHACAHVLGKDAYDAAYTHGQSMTQDEASTWMLRAFEHLSEDVIAC